MREIKFRAWDNDNKQWLDADKLGFDNLGNIYIFTEDLDGEDEERNIIWQSKLLWGGRDIKLMQFTGLRDKNGVEIYEGDLVRNFDVDGEPYREYVVQWHESTASVYAHFKGVEVLHWKPEDRLLSNSEKKWEVIGNIYEHPELLRKEGK